jgi:hypothetical protein
MLADGTVTITPAQLGAVLEQLELQLADLEEDASEAEAQI